MEARQRSLSLFQKLGNQEAIGSVLNYIGINYQNQGNYDKAIDYCLQGLQLRRKLNDHPGIAFSLINMGNMYLVADKMTTALDYYQQSLAYTKKKHCLCWNILLQLGETYRWLGRYEEALSYLQRLLKSNSNLAAADPMPLEKFTLPGKSMTFP